MKGEWRVVRKKGLIPKCHHIGNPVSPVYFIDVTPEMKSLIDRSGYVSLANKRIFKNKVGSTVAAVRRSGGMHAIDSMNHFLLSQDIFLLAGLLVLAARRGKWRRMRRGCSWRRPSARGWLGYSRSSVDRTRGGLKLTAFGKCPIVVLALPAKRGWSWT